MARVKVHEAKTQLSKLLARVERGEEVVVCRGDQPAAKIVPLSAAELDKDRRPPVGTVTSAKVTVVDGAFLPLTDAQLAEWGL